MTDRSPWRDAVFQRLGAGLVVQNAEGAILDCNAAAERLLGLSKDQMTGRTSMDPQWRAIHPDGSEFPGETHPAMVALRTGEPVRDVVMGWIRRDESTVWIIINSEPLPQDESSPAAVVTSFTDITAPSQRNAEQLQVTVDSMLDPHMLFRAVRDDKERIVDATIAQANAAASDFLDMSKTELVGRTLHEVLGSSSSEQMLGWVTEVLESGAPLMLEEVQVEHPFDEGRVLDFRAVRLEEFVSFTWRDVTTRVRAATELAESEELFRTAMRTAISGMAVTDPEGNFQVVNEALCTVLARDEHSLLNTSLLATVAEGFRGAVEEQLRLLRAGTQQRSVLEVQAVRPGGRTVWIQIGIGTIKPESGQPTALLVQVEDISGEREAREELAYQAFHDPLTGLYNRARLMETLERELRVARRNDNSVGLLFIDLDNFKIVNDSLGHAAGDMVLTTVADRIQSVLRPRESAGRFGGDEFVVVVTDVQQQRDVEHVAERALSVISHEIRVLNHRIVPTASVGMAISDDESTPESLLRGADAALFRAKEDGKSRWHCFDEAMHDQAVARMTLESQMRHGLDEGQFTVHFQPLVNLATGEVTGHEALARWQHPQRGQLAASEFIPVAEETGLIVPLGQRVLDQTLGTLSRTSKLPGPISINVSAVQLASLGWATRFLDTLAEHGVDPHRITVEVTETAVLSFLDRAGEDLRMLRKWGVGVVVDDFGTGFSSISLLRELPVTGVKLDKSFVRNLTQFDSAPNALAAGVAGLAHGLHLMPVAEGIETAMEAEVLRAQGWTHGQGYYFGRPVAVL